MQYLMTQRGRKTTVFTNGLVWGVRYKMEDDDP